MMLKSGPVVINQPEELRQKIIEDFTNEKTRGEKVMDNIADMKEKTRFEGEGVVDVDYGTSEHYYSVSIHFYLDY